MKIWLMTAIDSKYVSWTQQENWTWPKNTEQTCRKTHLGFPNFTIYVTLQLMSCDITTKCF